MAEDKLRLQDLNNLLNSLKVGADVEYRSLIISLDIGTTYSGVGYIFTADLEKVHILDQWPGQTASKVTSPKVPTVLKYGTGGPGFSWGYQVGLRDEKKVEAFKILLDQSLPKPEYTQINKVQKNFREYFKTPINAINDYMGALYRHAIEAIEEKHSNAYAEILAVKLVVSTPAGWPDTIKGTIVKAARDVGAGLVTHITEAEAAARFSLQSTEVKALKLKAGDTVMVCDAGGATIDLTTYTIKRVEPLQVVEFVTPLTRAGGALNLDKNFENHIMRNLLEEDEFIPLKKSPHYVETLKQFDQEIKFVFTNTSTRQFIVKLKGPTLTDYPDGNLKNNIMIFDRKALEVIYLPVANTVSTCITEQMNAVKEKKVGLRSGDMSSVDVIILTGGLGSNKYLRDHLGKKFPSMKFIQPANAGAVASQTPAKKRVEASEMFGFGGTQNNRATANYGVTSCPVWNESDPAHRNEKRYWDDWEGVWRCKSIKWLIKKGDDLRKTKRVSLPCYKQCGANPMTDEFFIIATLEQSTSAEPPDSSTHYSISTKRAIRVPLDRIPDECFLKKSRSSDRVPYWQLAYDVVLDVSNAKIAFWVEIGGKHYGRQAVN